MMLWVICGLVFVSMTLLCGGAALGLRALARAPGTTRSQAPRGSGRVRASTRMAATNDAGSRRLGARRWFVGTLLMLGGLTIGWALHLSLIVSLGVGLFAWVLFRLRAGLLRRKRQQAFLEQLPSALELMANALRAGLGVNSAFGVVAEEIPAPLGREFSKMVAEINLGANYGEALSHLVERNPSGHLRLLAQAIVLHKQVGGNLAEVLDNLDRTIRERFALQREMQSLTAEQQLTGWVLGLLPLAVGATLAVLNPDYILTLFRTTQGQCLVGVVIALQVCGVLTMWRILQIEF